MEWTKFCKKKTKRIKEEKKKNMGFISKEAKKKLKDININPKTNKPIKKTRYNSENIIKKIIRINIRQLNILLNNNINDKERYLNLSNILAINSCAENANKRRTKNEYEVFKQLEENNPQNSISNVSVNDYEKIKNMTIQDIFKNLNVSKIYKNFFPFHNNILINLILKNNNEDKVNTLLNLNFSELLLYYQYSPIIFNQDMSQYIYNENIIYYIKKIQNIEKDIYKDIITLKRKISKINFEGVNSLFDTIIKLQNKKNEDDNREYNDEYITKYIDIALGFHDFFLKRRKKINKKKKKFNTDNKNKNEDS